MHLVLEDVKLKVDFYNTVGYLETSIFILSK